MPSDIARRISRQYMDRLMENVRIWIDRGGPDFHSQFPEWSDSNIKSQEEAATAYELVRDLSLNYDSHGSYRSICWPTERRDSTS